MGTKGKTNLADTERIQISLDQLSYGLLGKIAKIGMDGRSHAEVASKIVREWLKANAKDTIHEGNELQKLANRPK